MVGSFPYIAPEVIESGEPTSISDIWAVGCIGYELCTGQKLPHTRGLHVIDAQRIVDYAHNIDMTEIPSKFGSAIRSVITDCLMWDPSTRPTARKILNYMMQEYEMLDINALETCCISATFNPRPIAASDATSIGQLEDKTDYLDDDWTIVSSQHDSIVKCRFRPEGPYLLPSSVGKTVECTRTSI